MKSIVFIALSLVSFAVAIPQDYRMYHYPYSLNYQEQHQQQPAAPTVEEPAQEYTVAETTAQEAPVEDVGNTPPTDPGATDPEITDPTIVGMKIQF